MSARSSAGPFLIVALGDTQVVGYGSLYYAFAVLAPRITESFGWAAEWTYGGLAIGLLVGGAVAPLSGRLIDRHGTCPVMALGSLAAGLFLLLLAEARGIAGYLAAMIAVQAVSTAVLYDAAFAALTQARGSGARRAISQLTLIGGFASTLFWPLTSHLLGSFDWRAILRIYAASQILLCVPLHAWLLPGRIRAELSGALPERSTIAAETPVLSGVARRRAFILLALAFSLQGFVISAISVHLIGLLQGLGLAATAAVATGAMIGPSQVAGRLAEMLFGRRLEPVQTAWIASLLMPVGLLLLLVGNLTAWIAGAFAIAFGISMGLGSIVRGTVPLQLFGPVGYGATMGRLAMPGLAFRAAAPLAFAVILERAGPIPGTLLLASMAACTALAFILLARVAARG